MTRLWVQGNPKRTYRGSLREVFDALSDEGEKSGDLGIVRFSKDYAVKKMKNSEWAMREVKIMQKLNKQNCLGVPRMLDYYADGGDMFIQMEKVNGKDFKKAFNVQPSNAQRSSTIRAVLVRYPDAYTVLHDQIKELLACIHKVCCHNDLNFFHGNLMVECKYLPCNAEAWAPFTWHEYETDQKEMEVYCATPSGTFPFADATLSDRIPKAIPIVDQSLRLHVIDYGGSAEYSEALCKDEQQIDETLAWFKQPENADGRYDLHHGTTATFKRLRVPSVPNTSKKVTKKNPPGRAAKKRSPRALKPCALGSERNPKTNRCRKKCSSSTRRSPKTGRCIRS